MIIIKKVSKCREDIVDFYSRCVKYTKQTIIITKHIIGFLRYFTWIILRCIQITRKKVEKGEQFS